jgi:hypothetical protein
MSIWIGIALLLFTMATPARAQQADPRWAPWLGCWQTVNEPDTTVCVAPASRPGAVTLTTRAAKEPALEQLLVADGTPQPLNEAGCTGMQRAEWSREGRRLFARADLTCASQPARAISGLSMIASDGTWLDVQAMEIDGRPNVRVRRYQRAAGQRPLDVAQRRQAGASWTLEDVKEAAAKMSPAALEAALIESRARFGLNSRALVELAATKVPGSVIDLMVALSYPEKFQVERRADASVDLYPSLFADAETSAYLGYGLGYPYFSAYPGYYGNYRYYFSPFGYAYYGLYPYSQYSQYYPGSSIAPGSEPAPAQRSGEGRVIDGVGYTRVRPREAQPADNSGGTSSTSSRGRATSSGYSQDGGSSSSSSSSSGSSSGGSSGGGSDSGRTAQPR